MRFNVLILGAFASVATAALSYETLTSRQTEGFCNCHPHCACPSGLTCYCVEGLACLGPCCVDEGGDGCGCPTGSTGNCVVSESPPFKSILPYSRWLTRFPAYCGLSAKALDYGVWILWKKLKISIWEQWKSASKSFWSFDLGVPVYERLLISKSRVNWKKYSQRFCALNGWFHFNYETNLETMITSTMLWVAHDPSLPAEIKRSCASLRGS